MACVLAWSCLRRPVEKLDDPGFERVLGAHNKQPVRLDELLEDLRSVPQVVRRGADVRAHGLPHQGLRIAPELGRQQGLDGRPDPVDDRAQVSRLVGRLLKLFEGR